MAGAGRGPTVRTAVALSTEVNEDWTLPEREDFVFQHLGHWSSDSRGAIRSYLADIVGQSRLPATWVVERDKENRRCYRHVRLKRATLQHPLAAAFRDISRVASETLTLNADSRKAEVRKHLSAWYAEAVTEWSHWAQVEEQPGKVYYYNQETMECTWDDPAEEVLLPYTIKLAAIERLLDDAVVHSYLPDKNQDSCVSPVPEVGAASVAEVRSPAEEVHQSEQAADMWDAFQRHHDAVIERCARAEKDFHAECAAMIEAAEESIVQQSSQSLQLQEEMSGDIRAVLANEEVAARTASRLTAEELHDEVSDAIESLAWHLQDIEYAHEEEFKSQQDQEEAAAKAGRRLHEEQMELLQKVQSDALEAQRQTEEAVQQQCEELVAALQAQLHQAEQKRAQEVERTKKARAAEVAYFEELAREREERRAEEEAYWQSMREAYERDRQIQDESSRLALDLEKLKDAQARRKEEYRRAEAEWREEKRELIYKAESRDLELQTESRKMSLESEWKVAEHLELEARPSRCRLREHLQHAVATAATDLGELDTNAHATRSNGTKPDVMNSAAVQASFPPATVSLDSLEASHKDTSGARRRSSTRKSQDRSEQQTIGHNIRQGHKLSIRQPKLRGQQEVTLESQSLGPLSMEEILGAYPEVSQIVTLQPG
mmetsp:Transcript_485/g.1575  ORF Transcript_485/g.1575 Transcript_485/m.1575 type:complete len:661 (-) Transcript_485:162-2144(-)